MRLPRLARGSVAWLTAGSAAVGVASQALVFASGVLAARSLGPLDRGHLQIFYLIPLTLTLIGGLGLPAALPYYIARSPAAARGLVRRVGPVLAVQVVVLAALQAVVLELTIIHRNPGIGTAAWISMAGLPGLLFQVYGNAILQGLRELRLFSVLRLLPWLSYTLALVAVLAAGSNGLTLVTAVWAGSMLAGGTITLVVALLRVPPARDDDVPELKTVMGFGARGMLGASSPVDDLQLDQILVSYLLDARSLGLYVAGLALTNLPRFIAQSVGLTLYPQVAAQRGGRAGLRLLGHYLLLTLPLLLAIIGVLELAAGWLLPWLFGASFAAATTTARILLLAGLFFCLRRLLSDGARGLGHPAWGAIAEAVSLVALLPAAFLLAGHLHTEGVALASLASAVVGVLVLASLLAGLARRTLRDGPAAPDEPRMSALADRPRAPRPRLRDRGALRAAVWLAVAGGVGALIGLLQPSTGAALLVAIGVTIWLPVIARVAQGRFDIFEPITFFAVAYSLMFVLRPASQLIEHRLFLVRPTRTIDISSTFNLMLALALLGALGFVIGYGLPLGRRLAERVTLRRESFSSSAAITASLMTGGVALLGFVAFSIPLGGPVKAAALIAQGRSTQLAEAIKGPSTYFWFAFWMLLPAGLVLLAVGLRRRDPVCLFLALVFGCLFGAREIAVGVGQRLSLLPLVGGTAIYLYLARNRRPHFATAIIVLLLALTASAAVLADRGNAPGSGRSVASVLRPKAVLQTATGGGSGLSAGADTDMAPAFAAALQIIPSQMHWGYGRYLIGDLLFRPVPRVLWKGKPTPPREQLLAKLWPEEEVGVVTNVEFSVLLHFYLDWGAAGVFLGMVLIGLAYSAVYQTYRRFPGSELWRITFALGVTMLPIVVRDSPVDNLQRAIFLILPAVLILGYARRVAARGGAQEAAPQRAPGHHPLPAGR